jgi:uncharacterized membrane protein YkvA (DUF1232 family)
MSQGDPKSIIPSPEDSSSARGFLNQLKLILRLIGDARISLALKSLPLISLIYLISPVDFLPVNPVDDAVVLALGLYTFVELCPDDIVEEHRAELASEARRAKAVDGKTGSDS